MTALAALGRAILAFVAAHQYPGLFFFLLIEEAGVPLPLPGDTLIMYAGVRSRGGGTIAALAILLVAAAATLGSSALYGLARRGGRPALARYGRFLPLHPERVDRMEGRFRRWGIWAIILGRLIPGLRTPTSVMAGLFGVPYRVFAPSTALSALIWTLCYFYLGAFFAPQWRALLTVVTGDLDASVGIAVLLGLAALVVAAVWRRRPRRAAAQAGIGPEAAGEAHRC
jgi:membrane protein DedA with SNARE-associated domain